MRNYALFLILSAAALSASAAPPDQADGVATVFEDVYVVNGLGDLVTPDPRNTLPDADLFTVSGVNLHLTWGQWSAATGTSAVHCAGGRTRARFDLSGLIPGGVYSIFHVTFNPTSHNPVCSNSGEVATVESFTADASGNARLHAEDAGCLLDAEELRYDVIYHADGNTYGALPDRGDAVSGCRNSFGSDALRQFIILQKFP